MQSEKKLPSQRPVQCLGRLRVFPTDHAGSWLVVGAHRDVTVEATTFRELLHEVRLAREVCK